MTNEVSFPGHIVLCGSTDSFLPFIKELRQISEAPIIILHPTTEFDDYESLIDIRNVSFVEGSPTDNETVEKADILHSRHPKTESKGTIRVLVEPCCTFLAPNGPQMHRLLSKKPFLQIPKLC